MFMFSMHHIIPMRSMNSALVGHGVENPMLGTGRQ